MDKGYIEIVKVLLDAGANPSADDNEDYTALMFAAIEGHAEIARVLVENGANINSRNVHKATALMYAMFNDNANIVKILLNCGANPKTKNRFGDDVFDYAKLHPLMPPIFEEYQRKIDSGWHPKSCKRG